MPQLFLGATDLANNTAPPALVFNIIRLLHWTLGTSPELLLSRLADIDQYREEPHVRLFFRSSEHRRPLPADASSI
jgi:hypothetical protein